MHLSPEDAMKVLGIVLGSEVHIDMFDDRVEITSPGAIFGGGSIQEYDICKIRSCGEIL